MAASSNGSIATPIPSQREASVAAMVDVTLLVVLPILATIAIIGLVGVRDGNTVLITNAAASLAVGLIPLGLEFFMPILFDAHLGVDPVVHVWVAGAALIHALGMYGLYESIRWWDHLAHTVSAALIAAGVYATVVMHGEAGRLLVNSPAGVANVTVGLTLLLGAFWELLEVVMRDLSQHLEQDPLLVPYGRWDTVLDLVFDVVGAIIVVALDIRVFLELARRFPVAATVLLTGAIGLGTIGTPLLGLVVIVYRSDLVRV